MKPWWEEERWLRGDFWVQNSVLQGHTEKWEGGCVCPSRACGTVSYCVPSGKSGVPDSQPFWSREGS